MKVTYSWLWTHSKARQMKNKRISIRIDSIEFAEMEHDARQLKRPVSEYLRYLHKKFGHIIAEEMRQADKANHNEFMITKAKVLEWVKEVK